MTNPTIRFIRRGQIVTLANVPPSRTLLEVLREDLGSTATKEGCGEGDCGACTVVLGEAVDGRIEYRAINACIRLAHSIDGLALWTAEDLASDPLIVSSEPKPSRADGAAGLHPVQEALVQCHGSQCGFCTPGFAMSLFGLYQNRIAPTLPAARGSLPPEGALAPRGGPAALATEAVLVTREEAATALSGNLCRCTGYRPILDAAETMARYPARAVNEAELLIKMEHLKAVPRWEEAKNTQNPTYLTPVSLPELLTLRRTHPDAQIVAGCTDVGLWVTKQHRDFAQVLDVTRVAELRRVERYPHHIAIGAAVTLADAFEALVADRPQLLSFAQRFAGLPVRNSGTLGGNVANGSPIGDSMPLLIALGANVVLMCQRGGKSISRELPLEQLYTGYRQNVMAKDEVLAWIKVPLPVDGEIQKVYKISKRFEDDISAVCLAVRLRVAGDRIEQASIGVGGVAATPVRAIKTEAFLHRKTMGEATFDQASGILRSEFEPISDMRASAAYRRAVLGNLMRRFWLECLGAANASIETLVLEVRK